MKLATPSTSTPITPSLVDSNRIHNQSDIAENLDSVTNSSITFPESFLQSVIKRREMADMAVNNFRNSATSETRFQQLVEIIRQRNQELKYLSAYASCADVSPDGPTIFWSGDGRDSSGNVTKSAKMTAQHIAKILQGYTIEMTLGGEQLDNYAGHPNSFAQLLRRFQYIAPDSQNPDDLRMHLITQGAKKAGIDVSQKVKDSLLVDPLRSTAAILWDFLSERFANVVTADKVYVIHAIERNDPYFRSATYENSTWTTKEKPALIKLGITIIELFADDLKGHLKGEGDDQPRNIPLTSTLKNHSS